MFLFTTRTLFLTFIEFQSSNTHLHQAKTVITPLQLISRIGNQVLTLFFVDQEMFKSCNLVRRGNSIPARQQETGSVVQGQYLPLLLVTLCPTYPMITVQRYLSGLYRSQATCVERVLYCCTCHFLNQNL